MPSKKRTLTADQRRAKRERKKQYQIILVGGKQKRVPREPTIDDLPVDECIARNAAPIWWHQNEMWECTPDDLDSEGQSQTSPDTTTEIPF